MNEHKKKTIFNLGIFLKPKTLLFLSTLVFISVMFLPFSSGLLTWSGLDPPSYWKFNGGSNSNATDLGTNNLTLFHTSGINELFDGILNNATKSDTATTSYWDSTGTSLMDLLGDSYTFAVWINSSTGSSEQIFSKAASLAGANEYRLSLNSGGIVNFDINNITANTNTINGSTDLRDDLWHRIVVTFDNSTNTSTLYVDGQIIDNETSPNPSTEPIGFRFRVGFNGASNFWHNLSIDDLQFYRNNWSSTDVDFDYNNGTGREADDIVLVISESFSNRTLESAVETFSINVSVLSSMWSSVTSILIYNNIRHTSTTTDTGNNRVYETTLTVPSVISDTNISFNWEFGLVNSTGDISYINSTIQNQTVKNIVLAFCSPTNSVSYLNFTFKDETNLSNLNAKVDASTFVYYLNSSDNNQTLTFSNSTANPNYLFCFLPPYATITIDVTFKYSNTGYPLRTFQTSGLILTNQTTKQVLYMLGTDNGIYSSIQTVNSYGTPIPGVQIIVERLIGSEYVVIEQGNTDSSGLVTFWLNPNFDHRITATKTGFLTQQNTIRPSQSIYTLILGTVADTNASYVSLIDGISWKIFPASGKVDTNLFAINLTATKGNLVSCKMDLVRSDDSTTINTTTGGSSNGCNLTIYHTLPTDVRIFGQFYISTDESGGLFAIDTDALWYNISTSASTWTQLSSFFDELMNIPELSRDQIRNEFTRVILFWFVIMILMGFLTFTTEYDRNYPGFFVSIVTVLIIIASYGGFMTLSFGNQNVPEFFKQYSVAIIASLFCLGYILNTLAKQT